jgi:hypothetical protein
MTKKEPRLNVSRIDFPSDHLTVKDLRHLFSDSLDTDDITASEHPKELDNLQTLIRAEDLLAQRAFALALGRPAKDYWPAERQDSLAALPEMYAQFGLATGEQQTQLLVRQLEAAAAAQAKEYLGNRR